MKKIMLQALYVFTATDDAGRKTEICQAIDQLNEKISQLSPGKSFTDEYLQLISKAQSSSEAGRWFDAYNTIWRAAVMINSAVETVNTRLYRGWLAVTPLFTFALIFIVYRILGKLLVLPGGTLESNFAYVWAGTIGGTTAAYYGLVKHTILLDFDDKFNLWYYLKPLFGAVFGLLAVLIFKAGFFSMQPTLDIKNQLPLYVIAFIAGFSERFCIRLIDRVSTALLSGSEASNKTAVQEVPKGEPAIVPMAAKSQTVDASTGMEPEHPGMP